MALVWKTITLPLDEVEENGSSSWEPFAIVEENGRALVICRGQFNVETDDKSTEVSGPIANDL